MAFLHSFTVGDFLDSLVSLFAAFVLGTLIGAERQYRQRGGGLRTHVLVAVGAATFVDIGMHLNGNAGATQIIAYVVSGVGFLGAGVIMKEGSNVWGLNTAATLWCSAAVGACAGADLRFRSHRADRFRARRQYAASSAGQRHQSRAARSGRDRSDLRGAHDDEGRRSRRQPGPAHGRS